MSQYHANYHVELLRSERTWHALANIKAELGAQAGFLKLKTNMVNHIMSEEPGSAYWKHVRYMTFQLWGIQEGYNHIAKHFNVHPLSLIDMLFLNSGGEMASMVQAFTPVAMNDRLLANSFLQISSYIKKLKDPEKRKKAVKHLGAALERRRSKESAMQKESHLAKEAALDGQARRLRSKKSLIHLAEVPASPPEHPSDMVLGPGAIVADAVHGKRSMFDDKTWEAKMAFDGHCSAIVRVADSNADLLIGHNTWGDYAQMLRIFKYYSFPLKGSDTMATTIAMSGYPGIISSMDDYYQLDSGLAVMDTTLEIMDLFIWDKVIDFSILGSAAIPNFMHIMVTNRMAKTPQHWVDLMKIQNRGTYNVQWMVVDFNNFQRGKQVPDNLFWVLETIPGLTHTEDVSHRLRSHGYWGAYNRPYFHDIREKTGFIAAQKNFGALYSWEDCPRAILMRTRAKGMNNLPALRDMIMMNKYPKAGVSPNTPGHEISARFDVSPKPMQPFPNGGIDAKITNKCLFPNRLHAISGPSHKFMKPFSWKNQQGRDAWPGVEHIGMPDVYNFDWVMVTPAGPAPTYDC